MFDHCFFCEIFYVTKESIKQLKKIVYLFLGPFCDDKFPYLATWKY